LASPWNPSERQRHLPRTNCIRRRLAFCHVLLAATPFVGRRLEQEQPPTLLGSDVDCDASAHAPDSHTTPSRENPKWIPPSDFVH
jgi:hypothetical protein